LINGSQTYTFEEGDPYWQPEGSCRIYVEGDPNDADIVLPDASITDAYVIVTEATVKDNLVAIP